MKIKYTSKILKQRIGERFPSPAYSTLFEVRDATAGMATRSADAISFCAWPSRGFDIIGFEIKSHRGDWLNELKTPEKAENIYKYCDKWYIVGSDNIIHADEVPNNWGWLAPEGNGLKEIIKPKELKPKEVSKEFVMSIMRNVNNSYTLNSKIENKITEEAERRLKFEKAAHERQLEEYQDFKDKVTQFEKSSGLTLGHTWKYSLKDLGKIVNAIINSDLSDKINKAKIQYNYAKNTLESLEAMHIIDINKIKGE